MTASDDTPQPTDASTDVDSPQPTDTGRDIDTQQYLYRGGLALLGLIATVALFRFYLNVSRAISTFVTPEYEPLFQAAFNLVVLLVAVLGGSVVLRKMGE